MAPLKTSLSCHPRENGDRNNWIPSLAEMAIPVGFEVFGGALKPLFR
jgi:hypothetical protein